jgi:hypothetical protein
MAVIKTIFNETRTLDWFCRPIEKLPIMTDDFADKYWAKNKFLVVEKDGVMLGYAVMEPQLAPRIGMVDLCVRRLALPADKDVWETVGRLMAGTLRWAIARGVEAITARTGDEPGTLTREMYLTNPMIHTLETATDLKTGREYFLHEVRTADTLAYYEAKGY